MSNDVDKSLLDRLQALRGASATPEKAPSNPVKFDVIERAKTPTGGDVLADRLKSLRSQADSSSPSSAKNSPAPRGASETPERSQKTAISAPRDEVDGDDGEDAMFATDDKALEEMLGNLDDVNEDQGQGTSQQLQASIEPKEEDVQALLEELSRAVPKDSDSDPRKDKTAGDEDQNNHSDDSDGEDMRRETEDVMARYRDEAEMDEKRKQDDESAPESESDDDEEAGNDNPPPGDLALPSVPTTGDDTPSNPSDQRSKSAPAPDLDDITARMAALRAPAEDSFALPDVPSSKPSGKPVNRLTSRTAYTDDDVDSWCTVCLEDAALRCLGCDDDVYCGRCWREMHVGPAAAFDDRTHKAVQFTKDRKKKNKKVALGAV